MRFQTETPLLLVTAAALGLAVLLLMGSTTVALAQGGAGVGVLSCHSKSGTRVNLLVRSRVSVLCQFKSPFGSEFYRGETGISLGLDLNMGRKETFAFSVFGAVSDIRPGSHALKGSYFGGRASATVGVGTGVAVMIGGGPDSLTLQPIALEIGTGVGIAGGLSYLYLEPIDIF